MPGHLTNHIRRLEVHEFGAFEDLELELSPGINVFIGRNSTGKTHLLKLLYAIAKSYEHKVKDHAAILKAKLDGVFKPADGRIGRLVHRARGQKSAFVVATKGGGRVEFTLSTLGNLDAREKKWPMPSKNLFLPPREVLAMYEGFIAAYESRELSFDETYYDACVALSANQLRGPRWVETKELVEPLEEVLGGSVRRSGDRFYIRAGGTGGWMEAHLVAEGLRKIAMLVHLITNGSLAQQGALFWDEPEANLNPRLVGKVAKLLQGFAKSGIQVFLASHDYLLTQRLSLAAEIDPELSIRFFSLSRRRSGGVEAEWGRSLTEIEETPMMKEFNRYFDEQRAAFSSPSGEAE